MMKNPLQLSVESFLVNLELDFEFLWLQQGDKFPSGLAIHEYDSFEGIKIIGENERWFVNFSELVDESKIKLTNKLLGGVVLGKQKNVGESLKDSKV